MSESFLACLVRQAAEDPRAPDSLRGWIFAWHEVERALGPEGVVMLARNMADVVEETARRSGAWDEERRALIRELLADVTDRWGLGTTH